MSYLKVNDLLRKESANVKEAFQKAEELNKMLREGQEKAQQEKADMKNEMNRLREASHGWTFFLFLYFPLSSSLLFILIEFFFVTPAENQKNQRVIWERKEKGSTCRGWRRDELWVEGIIWAANCSTSVLCCSCNEYSILKECCWGVLNSANLATISDHCWYILGVCCMWRTVIVSRVPYYCVTEYCTCSLFS